MTVYIDDARISWKGKRWSHMTADNIDELHAFAQGIGLKRDWFQDKPHHQHYDFIEWRRAKAIKHGAVQLTRKDYARKVMKLTGRDKALGIRTTHN